MGVRKLSDAIITSLIVAISGIICQLIINSNNRKKRSNEEQEKDKGKAVEAALKDQKLQNRLATIEQKLDIHNGYAEMLQSITKDIAVIKNDIQNLKENL